MWWTQALLLFGLSLAVFAQEEQPVSEMPVSGLRLKVAEEMLNFSLLAIAGGKGPSYTLERLISVTYESIIGSLYRYDTELRDPDNTIKKCRVEIWSQSWVKRANLVSFKCEGEEKVLRMHNV